MSARPRTRFELPEELSATRPPEARGLARDGVRLMVVDDREIEHARFRDLTRYLEPGDLLVVNTSGTLNGAAEGVRNADPVVVHFSTPLDDGTWVVELRTAPRAALPLLDAAPGETIVLRDGASLMLLGGYPKLGAGPARDGGTRLWRARFQWATSATDFLARWGRPIAYGYMDERWPLAAYQTVFANEPGSVEMPSAARAFTVELVTDLVAKGILIAPLVLHTAVSSQEPGEPPLPERFRVPAATARLVAWTRASGGRVIAVGTTAVRALESATRADGTVIPARGWTNLVLGPDRLPRVVDGLITGMHAPDASHLLLLDAVAGPELVERAYAAALERRYLWHEFGDLSLLLPARSDRRRRDNPGLVEVWAAGA
ncbi:MAG: S-adenosylmethionine:tRNA ribosyltransferase-isomerase [Actinomycetota bacterium]